jgi:hypothetical protein
MALGTAFQDLTAAITFRLFAYAAEDGSAWRDASAPPTGLRAPEALRIGRDGPDRLVSLTEHLA